MRKFFSFAFFVFFFATAWASIFDGIVAHYRLEQDATDYYGNYNGTGPVNGASYNYSYIGYGVNFDGTNDYYEFADFNPRGATGAYSISLWVNPNTSSDNYDTYIGKHESDGDNLLALRQNVWVT